MSTDLLECVTIEPPGAHRASIVWLHGLGADGNDFVPIVPELGLGDDHGVRFVFPHAPARPVTINGGMVMRAWYDILGMDLRAGQDEVGIRASQAAVEVLLAREKEAGIPADRIVLAGFSQGGAIAVFAGLRHTEALAGIMALSTYAVLADTFEAERTDANRATPIFQAHGTLDPMVTCDRGEDLNRRLVAANHEVEWHDYPMGHQVCLEEIEAIGHWLRARLGAAV